MFKRILVPLDGSSTAEIVLPYVIDIAPKCGSGIVLTRVSEPDISVEKCRSYLESTAEKLKSKLKVMQTMGQIQIDLRVLMGNPTYEILNCASDLECDLIALASRGASSQSQWPLGNVAAKILRASGRPILLVRKQVNDLPTAGKSLIKKIMVPLDGSRLSEASLPYAIILSQRLAAEVVLFRAIEPAVVITGSGEAITRLMAPEYTVTAISSRMKPFVLEYVEENGGEGKLKMRGEKKK